MNLSGYDNTLAVKPDSATRSDSGRSALTVGVQDLACSRGDKVLFSRINFAVTAGQLLLIEGANGSGKTSLLRTLCGFILPDEGAVLWRGSDIRACMDDYLADMHYVGHNNGIKPGLTCSENLKMARAFTASSDTEDNGTILQQFGLGQYIDTPAQMLSSGQRRRLALARLSVSQSNIWILDEPFTSLDEKGKTLIKAQFRRQLAAGGIIIVTSHEPIGLDDTHPVIVRL